MREYATHVREDAAFINYEGIILCNIICEGICSTREERCSIYEGMSFIIIYCINYLFIIYATYYNNIIYDEGIILCNIVVQGNTVRGVVL